MYAEEVIKLFKGIILFLCFSFLNKSSESTLPFLALFLNGGQCAKFFFGLKRDFSCDTTSSHWGKLEARLFRTFHVQVLNDALLFFTQRAGIAIHRVLFPPDHFTEGVIWSTS